MSAGNGHIAVSLPDDQLPPQSLLETDSLLGKDESQPLPAVNKTDPSQPLLPTDSVFENDVSRPHFTADATQPLLTATHESANVSRQDYGTLHTEHRSAHQSSSPDPGGPGVRPDVMLLEGDGQRPAVDLRKYVFVSMGIPVVVSAPKEFKRNCSKYIQTCICMYALYACIHAYMHTYIHTANIHTYIHIYIHTYS